MATWKVQGSDWEVVKWDENHLPGLSRSNELYLENALRRGKFANASDLIRYAVIGQHGGLYLDTDMALLRPVEGPTSPDVLELGWESPEFVNVALMAGYAGNWACKEALSRLPSTLVFDGLVNGRSKKWVIEMGGEETANINGPWLMTQILLEHGLKQGGVEQNVHGVAVRPWTVFYPVRLEYCHKEGAVNWAMDSPFSVAVHRWSGSWLEDSPGK